MKPLISYYGGKQRMVKNLLPLIPPHKIYCEPFCGGASLFFAKGKTEVTNDHHYREVLNDTNRDLITMYYVVQKHKEEFIKELELIPYSEYWFYYSKTNKNKELMDVALAYFIKTMMGFANMPDRGFEFCKRGENNAKSYYNHLERLPEIIDRLKGVYIFNRDALNIIDKFDCSEAFFYCDPPYPNTDQGHYKGYTQSDFEKLIFTLSNCKGSFMLSCYDNAAVPADWERYEFHAVNSSSNTAKGGHRQKRTEVVWRKLSDYAKANTPDKQLSLNI